MTPFFSTRRVPFTWPSPVPFCLTVYSLCYIGQGFCSEIEYRAFQPMSCFIQLLRILSHDWLANSINKPNAIVPEEFCQLREQIRIS